MQRDQEIRARLLNTPSECFISQPYSGYGNGIDSCPVWFEGIYYNSVTEARWACLFNYLGIRYEFEDHKVEVDGTGRKPDFFLPDFNVLVEVGPASDDVFEQKTIKGQKLADASGTPVIVTYGFPRYQREALDLLWADCRVCLPEPLEWKHEVIEAYFPYLKHLYAFNGPTVENALGVARSYNFEAAAPLWIRKCKAMKFEGSNTVA